MTVKKLIINKVSTCDKYFPKKLKQLFPPIKFTIFFNTISFTVILMVQTLELSSNLPPFQDVGAVFINIDKHDCKSFPTVCRI